MKQLLVILVLALAVTTGCAARTAAPTIRGTDLYAQLRDLQHDGRVFIRSTSHAPVEVRMDQYLVDRGRSQVFVVDQLVTGCTGNDITSDPNCTLALVADQRFTVEDAAPQPRSRHEHADNDIEPINKARIVMLVAGVAMGVGAAKCDAFDGCGELLAIGAGLDAFLLLVTYTGFR